VSADIPVVKMGLTTGGRIGAETALTLDAYAGRIDAIVEAALDVCSDIILLCHGPIAEPADALSCHNTSFIIFPLCSSMVFSQSVGP
jgi:predicted TIM-barrel enzyme